MVESNVKNGLPRTLYKAKDGMRFVQCAVERPGLCQAKASQPAPVADEIIRRALSVRTNDREFGIEAATSHAVYNYRLCDFDQYIE